MRSRLGKPKNFRADQWTDIEDATLVHLWCERHWSMGAIAQTMRTTRNAVAGRIKRLNISRKAIAQAKAQA